MANEAERVMKMEECVSVKFHAKDKDGGTVFVDIEGKAAQEVLDFLKRGLTGDAIKLEHRR